MGGAFVISLDFELYWGVRDKRRLEDYRANLLGVRQAVPRMLEVFRSRGLAATWAAVGLLAFDGRDDALAHRPERLPRYTNPELSPYAELERCGDSEADDPYHFAPSLLRLIRGTAGQELGTHTFSHYYCLEDGQSAQDFAADLRTARQVAWERFGADVQSIVFPRNQLNADYLEVCRQEGLRAFRGNPDAWIYRARNEEQESLARRGARLLDAYLPLSGPNGYRQPRVQGGLLDVGASRFLRPYSARLGRLDPLRLQRILLDMELTARRGGVYHLWWHPHNFGVALEDNIGFLERILDRWARLDARHRWPSASMGELADRHFGVRARERAA